MTTGEVGVFPGGVRVGEYTPSVNEVKARDELERQAVESLPYLSDEQLEGMITAAHLVRERTTYALNQDTIESVELEDEYPENKVQIGES